MIELAKTTPEDLETLFIFQTDKVGVWMAAFTAKDPGDKEFYMKKWTGLIKNPDIMMQTMRLNDQIVGSVIQFDVREESHVSYWIDRPYWGKGIATEGLKRFL